MEADAQRHTAFSCRELSNQIRAETLSWKSQSRRLAKRLFDGGDLNDSLIRSSLRMRLSTGLDSGEPFWRTENRQDHHHPIAKNSLSVFAGPQTTSLSPDRHRQPIWACSDDVVLLRIRPLVPSCPASLAGRGPGFSDEVSNRHACVHRQSGNRGPVVMR